MEGEVQPQESRDCWEKGERNYGAQSQESDSQERLRK